MTKGDRPQQRSRSRLLSPEDRTLWDHVASSVKPHTGKKARVPQLPETFNVGIGAAEERLQSRLMHETSLTRQNIADAKPLSVPPAATTRNKTPPLADFDRKAVRRIRSGRIEIEARIDLHGMRQDEANRALRSFLIGSHARGHKWVLVITGKGRVLRDESWQDAALFGGEERGVLRRAVPRWLAEPELRPIVVSYTTAAIHHGGEGALYVQLRARRDHDRR